jgi:hypothetical protein
MQTEVLDRSTWTAWLGVTPSPDEVTAYEQLVGSRSIPGLLPLTLVAASAQAAIRSAVSTVIDGSRLRGVVHLAEAIACESPPRSDRGLRCRSQVVGATPTARGATIDVVTQHSHDDESPVGAGRSTLLLLGESVDRRWQRSDAPPTAFAEDGGGGALTERVECDLAVDLALRYAEVSGDHNPIHLDDAAARDAGFPAAVLHGMCVFAIAVSALAATISEDQVPTSAGTRFARPVVAGERLRVGFSSRSSESAGAFRFRAESRAGTALRAGHLGTQRRP